MSAERFTPWAGCDLQQRADVFRLNGSSLHILESAEQIFDGITDVSDEVKNSPEYAETVARRLIQQQPVAGEMAREIKRRLDENPRFVVVDGLQFHKLPVPLRDVFVLAFSALIGRPTKTDKVAGKVIWDVTPREYLHHANTTFSEHNGEAEFHTDSQFIQNPERYFGLWSVKHASDGGGVNGLVDARMITHKLLSENFGKEAMAILSETTFPFRVPTVFTEQCRDDVSEVLMAPIFRGYPFMRYRKDTLQKGLIVNGVSLEPKVAHALQQLEEIIDRQDLVLHHFLQAGQVLFANNHEVLHNRSAFVDRSRHLLRVRMNEYLNI